MLVFMFPMFQKLAETCRNKKIQKCQIRLRIFKDSTKIIEINELQKLQEKLIFQKFTKFFVFLETYVPTFLEKKYQNIQNSRKIIKIRELSKMS